jgi:hypothetical protein
MCLVTKQKTFKIASSDITCYKVVIVVGINYITPFRRYCFKDKNKVSKFTITHLYSSKFIEEGLHSYKYKGAAERFINNLAYRYQSRGVKIIKVIIPKGTKYYSGQSLRGEHQYCSLELNIANKKE